MPYPPNSRQLGMTGNPNTFSLMPFHQQYYTIAGVQYHRSSLFLEESVRRTPISAYNLNRSLIAGRPQTLPQRLRLQLFWDFFEENHSLPFTLFSVVKLLCAIASKLDDVEHGRWVSNNMIQPSQGLRFELHQHGDAVEAEYKVLNDRIIAIWHRRSTRPPAPRPPPGPAHHPPLLTYAILDENDNVLGSAATEDIGSRDNILYIRRANTGYLPDGSPVHTMGSAFPRDRRPSTPLPFHSNFFSSIAAERTAEFLPNETGIEFVPTGPRIPRSAFFRTLLPADCSMCIEPVTGAQLESGEAGSLVCGHLFHEECIDMWVNASGMMGSNLCPNCKTKICQARERTHMAIAEAGSEVGWHSAG